MKAFQLSKNAKNAILIGGMCSVAYLAVYLARNTLSAVSPKMEEAGVLNDTIFATLSSVYFFSYAVGQLINGAIGDKIKAKYMISVGLAMAGVCNLVFSLIVTVPIAPYIAYGATGFSLAMIYGPMTKLVAENTEPIHATRCSLGYTFASFFGSPLAGLLAAMLAWRGVFAASSIVLIVMAVSCFTVFHVMERRGIVKYGQYIKPENKGSVKTLIKHRIIKFTLISVITGVVRTTLVSWLTKYFTNHLGYDAETTAPLLFTVATLVISASSFIAIFVYERLGHNMDLTILLSFIVSTIAFVLVGVLHNPIANIIFIVIGIMANNCAATMLWSRYCPSLRDTGMVSSATGFLDFMSYMSAAVSTQLFPFVWNWSGFIFIIAGLMLCGVIVALPRRNHKEETLQ